MSCASGSLNAYVPSTNTPWNRERVAHLYRRMGFGATPQQITDGLALSPTVLVDQIIDQAIAAPLSPPPVWSDWTRSPVNDYTDFDTEYFQHASELRTQWVQNMLNHGFRDKLTLFWGNHFVTEVWKYQCSAYLYQYHRLLEQNCLGNFRDFVVAMGKTPAMLIYLDNNANIVDAYNENYARELMELFTLGEGNGYTEDDVWEVTRALTGWVGASPETCELYSSDDERFNPALWDSSSKTIFGQTGNWGYDDVHNLIFTYRTSEVAHFICEKLYKFFVYERPNAAIVEQLAQTFINNNFELAPVFRQLFKSEHFFDFENIGHNIKSPVEFYLSLIQSTTLPTDNDIVWRMGEVSGWLDQWLFAPVNVAGWPGHRTWITEDSLVRRWDYASAYFLNGNIFENENVGTQAAANLVDFAKALSNNSNDPTVITTSIINHLMPKGLPSGTEYETATLVFRANIPSNYYDDGTWNLDWAEAPEQIRLLLNYLIRIPEFQLV